MPKPELYFDEARADRIQRFFERALVHTKGRYARKPFILTDWQRDDIVRPLFGTVRYEAQLKEYVRAYNLAWVELARKNGKSELVAGVGLYLLAADGEEGAEIYGAARDKDQASVIYQVADRMVELSRVLSKQLTRIPSKRRIVDEKTGSFYQVIAADGAGNLGSNPHGVLFDEVITQPNAELWDALKTGMGTRDQPLMMAVTTAGNDPHSMAAEEHNFSEQVLADPDVDPSRFVFMRNTPPDAEWTDEANWAYANPGLGDFLRLQVLRDELNAAVMSPQKQNAFRQFRLNQWVRQVTRWLDMGLWDANAGLVMEEELRDADCFGGLDLASRSDFAAWTLFFPGEEEDHVLARFFLPEAALEGRPKMRDKFELWASQGFLTITEGAILDYSAIEAQVDRDCQSFNVLAGGYDRWNADQLVRNIDEAGLEMIPIPQTANALNAASRNLEARLGLLRLHHGGNPVLRWMADNVQVQRDANDNIKPDKKHSHEKIDGIAALVMSLKIALEWEGGAFAVGGAPDAKESSDAS